MPQPIGISGVLCGLLLAAFLIFPEAHAAVSSDSNGNLIFAENFAFKGNHAATIKGSAATTVWWNENDWDARADTAHNAITYQEGSKGHHIDIHHAFPDGSNGSQDNIYALGGNDGTGVGVMHVDFEGIVSARLRNPMLISSSQPGVVEFRTSNFVTTAHWWEIAIAPTQVVTPAEFTAIPAPGKGNDKSLFAGNPGSGHRPADDSVNFITIGRNDVPCRTGWEFQNGVTKIVGGIETDEVLGPVIASPPEKQLELYSWRLEFYQDRINVFVDLDNDGIKEPHASFNVTIPWNEVYVYLITVAYQADHHPQGECWQGTVREMPWKEVKVWPVKYSGTAAFPKNDGISLLPLATGWAGYDIRDTQRFGLPVNGIPQPNLKAYGKHNSMAFCHEDGNGWYGCSNSVSEKQLFLELPADAASSITRAQFVYDTRMPGSAKLSVNRNYIGEMPRWTTVEYPEEEDNGEWVQRSIDIPAAVLQPGANTVEIAMDGNVGFDRMHLELGYSSAALTPHLEPNKTITAAASLPSNESTEPAQITRKGDSSKQLRILALSILILLVLLELLAALHAFRRRK